MRWRSISLKFKNKKSMEKEKNTADREIRISRLLDAPVELVWEVIEALSALAAIEQRRVDLVRDAWLASVALDAAVASGTPGGVP